LAEQLNKNKIAQDDEAQRDRGEYREAAGAAAAIGG